MDAVQKFRKKRIKRLENRFGKYHGPYRFDADDNEESNATKGGHGNTRIPFGLCQREGIEIQDDWSPSDAWAALEGKGYSAKSVYSELKKTGKAPSAKSTNYVESGISGETEKPKVDLKQAMDDVYKYRKNQKLLKKFVGENEALDKELRKAKYDQNDSIYYKGQAEKRRDYLLSQFGARDEMPEEERERYDRCIEQIQENEKTIKESEETIDRCESRKKEVENQIAELSKDEHKSRHDDAVKMILENSQYTSKVHEYRGIEEKSQGDRKKLKQLDKKIKEVESLIDSYKRHGKEAEGRGAETTVEFYRKQVELMEQSAEKIRAEREEISKAVGEYDKLMGNVKGEKKDKEWDLVYDLSVERDTVQDGPYELMQIVANDLKRNGVKYINPHKYINIPSENEIIERLGGNDKTTGSCVSLAFAYLANKEGYDVRDFRGGESRRYFSWEWKSIARKFGGVEETGNNDVDCCNKLLGNVEDGKEYILMTGRHGSVVRKNNGKMEFLELQDSDSGWQELNDSVLVDRFGCKRKRKEKSNNVLVGAEQIFNSQNSRHAQEFISLMGYINTDEEKQKKGAGGHVR